MPINIFTDYPLSWRPDRSRLKRPYYQSLVEQMKGAIESGHLLPDTKLPPQRELADFLDIGFATVTRAYKLSQQRGLTYGVVGRGTYVAKNLKFMQTISRNNAHNIRELGFNASFEANNYLIRSTVEEVSSQTNLVELLNYDEPIGLAKHRLIASRYMDQIGMTMNKENTMIVSGGQNALSIILLSLFNSGDKIAVDKFTYANFIELARLRGIELIPINDDSEGMSAVDLEQQCRLKNIKGIYLMPDYGNPTTITISEQRRQLLAQLIQRYKLILIEDDYLNFLNLYRQTPLTKMSNLVPEQSIYVCSMSKSLISGLRVGFIRTANQFRHSIENAIFNVNVKTSALDAAIVTRALQNGVASKIMQQKLNAVTKVNAIFDQIFDNQPTVNDYHFFRAVPVNSQFSGNQIEQTLLQNGIRVFHSDKFLVGSADRTAFLRVSLTSLDNGDELADTLIDLKAILIQNQFLI
ncbi:PLP-dependent aminotransferase family protein [Lactobacillus sp. Sy-1]|uniref:aminotransferase-like domain-containing protein n=1 Tax=Lactobacillus sp. Sy-1 TaxID=2109645 RepID=UPI001C5ACE6C|nr:PLP-dependent aminotransferase family protein [Lactobacillus sp. Sy-1]MBW1606395.1 PLP-dependent aminotransferase family protein [Lactobacillus sp. Sy-1]